MIDLLSKLRNHIEEQIEMIKRIAAITFIFHVHCCGLGHSGRNHLSAYL